MSLTAKFGEAEYKFLQMVEYQETKIGATLQLTRPLDNVKLFEIVGQRDSEEIKFLFKVSFLVSICDSEFPTCDSVNVQIYA